MFFISSYFSLDSLARSCCSFIIISFSFCYSSRYSSKSFCDLSAFYCYLLSFYAILWFSSFNCCSNLAFSSSISFWLFNFSCYNCLIRSIMVYSAYCLILRDYFLSFSIILFNSSSSSSNFLNNLFFSMTSFVFVATSSSRFLIYFLIVSILMAWLLTVLSSSKILVYWRAIWSLSLAIVETDVFSKLAISLSLVMMTSGSLAAMSLR